jgi:Uma2 family endonuclease/predicted HTH domain antitoxin
MLYFTMTQRVPNTMTEVEYLEFERASEIKHEYLYGEVFAMEGASEAHNLIVANLITAMKNQLRGRPCKVCLSDMRFKIDARTYTYPDIIAVCGDAKLADSVFDTLLNPIVIIEVLSPSTEAYDRGYKLRNYRKLASRQEYVLVSQDSHHIDHYLLQDNGMWSFTDAEGPNAKIELSSIGCTLTLTDVYEQVTFAEANDESNSTDTADDLQEVMFAYLSKRISLAKAAELLGLSRFDLMERFERTGIPLRQGLDTLEEAIDEVSTAHHGKASA